MNIFFWIIAIIFLLWVTTRFLKDYKKEIKDELREEIKDELRDETYKSSDWEDEDFNDVNEYDQDEGFYVGKMFGDALNRMTDNEMDKLTPAQRIEAEKLGEVFSEEFKKLNPSDQEKVWNSFGDTLREQKNKEWHEEWDQKLKEMGVKKGIEKKKI